MNQETVDNLPTEGFSAIVKGKPLTEFPTDLYIPPTALKVFLETFEGPLDLLLYLIQRQNLDILDIPIAKITEQYLQYIELMKEFQLDLAAEYLVIAALLMEIKSQLLLPVPSIVGDKAADPRNQLVQQLQEYARYKLAATTLDTLPQVDRDIFPIALEAPKIEDDIIIPKILWVELLYAMQTVMQRATLFTSHRVIKEPLSVRERMSIILSRLKTAVSVNFIELFSLDEGKAGVVVSLLAILELSKEALIRIEQSKEFGTIEVFRANICGDKSLDITKN